MTQIRRKTVCGAVRIAGAEFKPYHSGERYRGGASKECEDAAVDEEIEITAEMIEAGYAILVGSGLIEWPLEGDKIMVSEMYRAMHRARLDQVRKEHLLARTRSHES